jgi:hypothetical protein
MPADMAMGYERRLQMICFATADVPEGYAAFKEMPSPALRRR